MKNIRRTFFIGAGLALLVLFTACDSPFSRPDVNVPDGGADPATGDVIITAASGGQNARTILPLDPVFSRFELVLQKDGEEPRPLIPFSGSDEHRISLVAGNWTATLRGFQNIPDLDEVLAAEGIQQFTVTSGGVQFVSIILRPLPMQDNPLAEGLFYYNITLPEGGIAEAILILRDGAGEEVYSNSNLLETNYGSMSLSPGFYGMTIRLSCGHGRFTGVFEEVHIFSGLKSPATLDLSDLVFAETVYMAGTLGGIRLGMIVVADNEAGDSPIVSFNLPEPALGSGVARRPSDWVIEVPAMYIGLPLYIIQELDEERRVSVRIDGLPANGKAGINLNLVPSNAALENVALWYSELRSAGEGDLRLAVDGELDTCWNLPPSSHLELYYGFDVTVNFSRVTFRGGEGDSHSYRIEYWQNEDWVSLVERGQGFTGLADGVTGYSDFFPEVTAQRFRLVSLAGTLSAIAEFSLYLAADRSSLADAIADAELNRDNTIVADDGSEVGRRQRWVTPSVRDEFQRAIDDARTVLDDPLANDTEIAAAESALAEAEKRFNDAKRFGSSGKITVEGFQVQDGFADRFSVRWARDPEQSYFIYMSSDGNTWERIAVPSSTDAGPASFDIDAELGVTRYFAMRAVFDYTGAEGEKVFASAASQTLGIPQIQPTDYAHAAITAVWAGAQMADTYRILYRYTNEANWTVAVTLPAHSLTANANGFFEYAFRPSGYNDVTRAGLEMQVTVMALNEGLRALEGGGEISSDSEVVSARLVGPALLDLQVSRAASATHIDVSWNRVAGATGYYVFRRQFGMTNTSQASPFTAVYFVPAHESAGIEVTGRNLLASGADTQTVSASASFAGGRFTLRDSRLCDAGYDSAEFSGHNPAYRSQQNDMVRGYPYRYFVIPVIAGNGLPELNFSANGDISSYTLQEGGHTITFTGADSLERTGFTLGFVQDVTATKGTFSSTGNYMGAVNDGVRITWAPFAFPAEVPGFALRYVVFRRAQGSGNWEQIAEVDSTYFVDMHTPRGVALEYLVGITNATGGDVSRPGDSRRFADAVSLLTDNRGRPHNLGFVQGLVRMHSASREEIVRNGEFATRVTWHPIDVPNVVDGYRVFVINRNINANWHDIASTAEPQHGYTFDGSLYRIYVTSGMSGTRGQVDGRGLLHILRDYKHFYHVRSFVWHEGVRIYGPHPDWNWQPRWGAAIGGPNCPFETDHVKWGTRQVTPNEFIDITLLFVARSIDRMGTWTSHLISRNHHASTGRGGSGHINASSNAGVTSWTFTFHNYRDDVRLRAGDYQTFITLNGRIWAGTRASGWPNNWGGGRPDWILTVTGPAHTPGLFSGSLAIGPGNGDMNWDSRGTVSVEYPRGAPLQNINRLGRDSPLPFHQQTGSWGRIDREDRWR